MLNSVSKSLSAFFHATISINEQNAIKGGGDGDGEIIIIEEIING